MSFLHHSGTEERILGPLKPVVVEFAARHQFEVIISLEGDDSGFQLLKKTGDLISSIMVGVAADLRSVFIAAVTTKKVAPDPRENPCGERAKIVIRRIGIESERVISERFKAMLRDAFNDLCSWTEDDLLPYPFNVQELNPDLTPS